jgi:hypothetical protein
MSRKALMNKMQERIALLEAAISRVGINVGGTKRRRFPPKRQTHMFNVMSKAVCIETIDPWKENRIRFYHPLVHHPHTPILSLPFARPISPFGGIDDSGVNWVPPAYSTVMIMYEMGHRDAPFYIGTTWQRDRGPNAQHIVYPSREYDAVYRGHRKGYLVGKDDESQSYPPWNTEGYNGKDIDDLNQFVLDPEEQIRTTYPHIYGFKTPEKHMLKMVDGNAKCNRRWKRIEIMSGCGNWFIMKDDHLHYGGQWSHPSCHPEPGGPPVDICSKHKDKLPYFTDMHGKPIEGASGCIPNCEGKGDKSCERIISGHPTTPNFPPSMDGKDVTPYPNTNKGTNPFFKHANECRPYHGPQTPQNNKCDLPQSGIQLLSIGGHTMVMDDSVKEPMGKPEWERSMKPFDFGCDDTCMGVFYLKSMTGHSFVMTDVENGPKVRGMQNYVEMKTGYGNRLHMNDHTEPQGDGECPTPDKYHAGQYRGIFMESTSEHLLQFCDFMNKQVGPCRAEGGVPINKASKAFVHLRSGYGHYMTFCDFPENQRLTQDQFIHLENPQCSRSGPKEDPKCNTVKGPHFLHMQASPKPEPGIVFLRVGGHHIRSTTDMDIVLVGTKDNPSDKYTYVSKDYTDATMNVHFRYAGDRHLFFAEEKIVLMAGRDCPPSGGSPCPGPCVFPVIVAKCPWTCPYTGKIHWTEKAISMRVFASACEPKGPTCNTCHPKIPDPSICAEQKPMNLKLGPPVQIQEPPNGTNVNWQDFPDNS